MKKLLAILLTLAVLCSVSVTALAAEAGTTVENPVVLSFQDFDTSVYDGRWVGTGLGFDVCIPEDWVQPEISEEDAEAGLAFLAGEEGGGANLTIVSMALPEEVADSYDYEQLGEELAESNTSAMYAELNGIPAVIFENEETAVCGFCILPGDGTLISAVISAPSDDEYEDYSPYMMNIIMSVSPSVTIVEWKDYEEYAAEVDEDADFAQIPGYNLAVWVPSVLEEKELDVEEGVFIAYLESADESAAVAVWAWENSDEVDLATLAESYADAGYQDAEVGLLNGIPVVTYSDELMDAVNVVLVLNEKEFLQISFWPASDEGFAELAMLMTASLQTIA